MLREHLKKIKIMYEPRGRKADWGDPNAIIEKDALLTADILRWSGIIPHPNGTGNKINILSPSSNNGLYEVMLSETLGPDYEVIAGDIAAITRIQLGQTRHLQLDANFLPFPDQSIDVVFDRQGALWHAATLDIPNVNSLLTLELFREFHRILKQGGVLITDQRILTYFFTGPLLDHALMGQSPNGFERPRLIGADCWQYRVYKKLYEC